MRVSSFAASQVTGTCTWKIAGPDGAFERTGFTLWMINLKNTEPLQLQPPPRTEERVLYVVAGRGTLRQEAQARPISAQHAYLWGPGSIWLSASGDAPLAIVCFSSPMSPPPSRCTTADLTAMEGIHFPARRWGRSIVNGTSPLRASGFTCGLSLLQPQGGQVPWHNHPGRQNEVYLVLGGTPQMCIDGEVRQLEPPAAVFIPGESWHQLTNLHLQDELSLIYCYEGDVAAPHWWQERDGVLPPAASGSNPPVPAGAFPQCTVTDPHAWARQCRTHLG